MKWFFFFLDLFGLFIANNALFWIPGKYDWFNFVVAGISILFAAACAWFSSMKFTKPVAGGRPSLSDIIQAPPAVIWLFVMFLFALFGLLKMLAYHH